MDRKQEDSKKWYVVYTMPRGEKKLKARLDALGIECFLPLLPQKKKWSDRYKIIETPIFPSYLFVKMNHKEESIKVLKEPMSVNFVHFEGKPSEISEEDIEMVRMFIEEYPEKIKVKEEDLKPGKKIEILYGVFAGRKAIIEKIKNSYSVILKIPALNRILSVEIKKEDLGY